MKEKKNLNKGQQAASAAILVPLFIIIMNIFTKNLIKSEFIYSIIVMILIALGFFAALYSLFKIKTCGREGILVKGLFAIIINGSILYFFMAAILGNFI